MRKNRTIFKKIFFGIMVLIIVTWMSYYGFIVYYEYKSNTETAVKESIELSEKINRAINDYITQIDGTITTFYYELYQNKTGALATLLTGRDKMSEEEKLWQKEALEKYFSQLFLMRGDFVDVYVYKNQGEGFLYSPYAGKKRDYSMNESNRYQDTMNKNGRTHITMNDVPEHINFNKPVIGFSRLLKNVGNQGITEDTVVMLDFTMKNLEILIDNYITNDMTSVLLVDDGGSIVYHRGAQINWKEKEKYIFSGNKNKVYEWKVVIVTNKDYIFMKTKDYLTFTIVISGLLIMAAALLSYLFAKTIYQPIELLKRGMDLIQNGEFDVRLAKKTDDELGYLIDNFNQMAYRTKILIQEKYEEELQKKDAQYKYLQAQIDPHFIFNTLQIISSMALVKKVPEIETVSNSLAGLIRYSISGDQKTVLLKEEIKNVINHLEIQKIRLKNRLSYHLEIQHEIEQISIIKMVLQPIVENGIQHGLKSGNGMIKVQGYMSGEKVLIEIKDNGEGMTEEEVKRLLEWINLPIKRNDIEDGEIKKLQMEGQNNHVGLRNINLRLKMYYGEDYGISIKSKLREGTTVTVCIRRSK